MSSLVSEHEERAPSIAFNQHDNEPFTETHSIAKLPPHKKLPPRDKKDSSPLDIPEIKQRALEQEHEESEHKVIQQLVDDKESLTGTPGPSAITLPNFNKESKEKEDGEETANLQFPPVEPPSPPRGPLLPPALTPVKPRATQATGTEMYILINRIKDEAVKVALFSTLISVGSQADLWWTNLHAAHKANWTAIRTAFIAKCPVIIAADKAKLEYQKESLVIHMKEKEVGEHITVAGIET
ncbi:hypothetical protein BDR04DRAFT_1119543 [Suillus decipiens]|nr:hypothetical protein BDR04DRAFT_1119543 [Suillus decipiens]